MIRLTLDKTYKNVIATLAVADRKFVIKVSGDRSKLHIQEHIKPIPSPHPHQENKNLVLPVA